MPLMNSSPQLLPTNHQYIAVEPTSELPTTDQVSIVQTEFQSAQSLYEAGVKFHEADQFFEAIAAYQQAIELDPNLDVAYINLSLLYIQLEQFELGKTILEQVLTLPDRSEFPASIHAIAHYNLAIIHNREEKLEAAIAESKEALAITPDFNLAQELLTQLQNQENPNPNQQN
jgi:superkiller protein 3